MTNTRVGALCLAVCVGALTVRCGPKSDELQKCFEAHRVSFEMAAKAPESVDLSDSEQMEALPVAMQDALRTLKRRCGVDSMAVRDRGLNRVSLYVWEWGYPGTQFGSLVVYEYWLASPTKTSCNYVELESGWYIAHCD